MRKLLSPAEVAEKLGFSLDWFYRNKNRLFKNGFPPPVFGNRRHARARWDDGAIDLWLDLKMPADLRQAAGGNPAAASRDWDSDLENRLQEVTA